MEGARVEKPQAGGRGKLALGIAAGVVGILAAGYLGLCAYVGTGSAVLPNVELGGISVGGMSQEQAQTTVEEQVGAHMNQTAVQLRCGDWSGEYTGGAVVDGAASAEQAMAQGRESFPLQGFAYLRSLLGGANRLDLSLSLDEAGERQLDALLDEADRAVGGGVTLPTWKVEGEDLLVTRGVTGVAILRDRAKQQVLDALNDGFAAGEQTLAVDLTTDQTPAEEPDFEEIHREVYTEAKSAEMDPETLEVTDHVVGLDFDPAQAEQIFAGIGEGETLKIPLTVTQPEVTRLDLEASLFKDLLGEGTTRVRGSSNRKYNVKLSAEACNNIILLPGEVFSYNDTTGSRSVDKGYLNAPVYKAGESVDDIGGGICQTSSTIYYAVLHTNLEVVERHCHQFNTGYVDLGMDATVYYGSLDFRFKNSTKYPVKIVTESYDSNGARYLTVKIYGTNPDGIYAVPKSSVFDKVSPTTVYKPKDGVARGSLVLDKEQYAYTGWSAHTYRYIYDKDGNELEKQDMGGSKYKMRPNTYFYNPADGDPSTWVNGKPPAPEQPSTPEAPANPDTPEAPDPATPEPEEPDVTVPPPGVELDLNPI